MSENKRILLTVNGVNGYFPKEFVEEAVKKQIPKKYEVWNGQCSCPKCHILFGSYDTLKTLISWKMDYCKFCGQALDWSDGERKDNDR